MSGLGDFLEVLHGPADRFETLRAVFAERRNLRLKDRETKRTIGRPKAAAPSKRHLEENRFTVWLAGNRQVRLEHVRQRGDQPQSSLTVVNGAQWWRRDHQGHVEISDGSLRSHANLIDMERHFNRAMLRQILICLALESVGNAQCAGQECVRIRAVPRPDGNLWPHWLPTGANEYEFLALPVRGILLSISAKAGFEVFWSSEVVELSLDEPLESSLFTFSPELGEQVRPADTIVEELTLDAAKARMPFTVLVPTCVPDADHSHFDVVYHPPRLHDAQPSLALMYRQVSGRNHLWINQWSSANPEWERFEWESIVHLGQPMRISDPEASGGMRIMALEQQGTYVTIFSDLDREQLLNLAASLVPA